MQAGKKLGRHELVWQRKEEARVLSRNPLHLHPASREKGSKERARQAREGVWAQLAGEDQEAGTGLLPLFPVLKLDRYLPGRGANRHSEAMLQTMLGRGQEGTQVAGKVQEQEGQGAPGPPAKEDTTYVMDAFWDDLGVGAPVARTEVEEDEEGLYEL